jgi:hypothetical protein
MSDSSTVYSIDDGVRGLMCISTLCIIFSQPCSVKKDFDREASKRVNNQLKEIESILYENNSYRPVQIEYKEWLEKFPHLRYQTGPDMPILDNQVHDLVFDS